ncbi:MAG: hypothetical protein EOP84_23460 [Verrucomicrobiaceae bacterium]|nr:MAG: hypothetical protein EOP84_23460 [Verrucomicrobiaceae bacterium]
MLVSFIIGACPGCKQPKCFGNVSVGHGTVLRGCLHCQYRYELCLPEVRKKVLYLDQFFFSGAFRGGDARFVEAAARVKRAVQLQLLVVPYSSVHEDETLEWRGYKDLKSADLMEFIKATSRGAEFERDYQVERTQIEKAWSAFLRGESSDFLLDGADAIGGEPDEWDDYYRVDVRGYHKDVELRRDLKRQSVDMLVNVFDQWQTSTTTFEQDFNQEVHDAAKNYLDSYFEMIGRVAGGDYGALLDSPIVSTVLEHMLHWIEDLPAKEQLPRCFAFFKSEHFRNVPDLWISGHIYATLKAMVRRGAYANRDEARKRLSGFFQDVRHISLYAPYCDGFFMDQPMADLVRQPSVGLQERYGVQVFNLNNLPAFFSWLDELEQGMSAEHVNGLLRAYPYLEPVVRSVKVA